MTKRLRVWMRRRESLGEGPGTRQAPLWINKAVQILVLKTLIQISARAVGVQPTQLLILPLGISKNSGFYLLCSEDAIPGNKLPSSGQVLSVFLHNHLNLKKERAESAKVVVGEVLVFWDKARIPTQRQDKILAKRELGRRESLRSVDLVLVWKEKAAQKKKEADARQIERTRMEQEASCSQVELASSSSVFSDSEGSVVEEE
ncbi:hypothetical protein GWK47_005376 [Chionoecetes opilio]|uniref:Uncharacterized protein n=1 Tax=Chionoecetes opilio TaxID=41210 RepID=A0A8J4YHL9_CHIOP|nr:hypothetical protein GWK47_005376 [Chionoecetes opilio]